MSILLFFLAQVLLLNNYNILMSKKLITKKFSTKTRKTGDNKNTITGKAVPYQILDVEKEIKNAVEDGKVEEKELALLEKELAKPYQKRNKALMNKYASRDTSSVDGYPLNLEKGGYNVDAIAMDDKDIDLSQRPKPYYVEILFKDSGNNFNYKFPISHHQLGDGETVYRLDGYNKYIYRDGTVADSLSDEITPYDILYNFRFGDKSLAEAYNHSSDGKTFYNFNFPNFRVSYSRGGVTVEGKMEPTGGTLQKVHFHDKYALTEGSSAVEAARVMRIASERGVDVGSALIVDSKSIVVSNIITGKGMAKNLWLIHNEVVHDTLDHTTGIDALKTKDYFIVSTLVSGVASMTNFMGKKSPTAAEVTKKVGENNIKIVKQYKSLLKSIGKRN